MKREVRLLRTKAIDSLLLGVDHFNTLADRGRATTTLVLLDHSMEMLLKAGLVHKGASIREKGAPQTIGFDACVRRALTGGSVAFLSETQALTLQILNGHRDAAQHHLLDLSEEQLYFDAQAAVTLFRDILKCVWAEDLSTYLPVRALPLSTRPPRNLAIMLGDELGVIKALLTAGKRRRIEARACVRGIAIMEAATLGRRTQPSDRELDKALDKLAAGATLGQVFPGVSELATSRESEGVSVGLRITKKADTPIVLVPEGTPDASVVAVKRVNELDYYSLGHRELARHVGLTTSRATAVIRALKLQSDPEYYKAIQIGAVRYQRYSGKAVERVKGELPNLDMDAVWREWGPIRRHA